MMKYISLVLVTFCGIISRSVANDGVYYTSGNQLIPISETDISVTKEVLYIKKVNNNYIEVSVYYEFFNPNVEKQLLVGFEAFSPSGDVNGLPIKGRHPFMHDFTVNVNNELLGYQVAIVADSLYHQNGTIQALKQIDTTDINVNEVPFYYVYNFKANFKKGLNIVRHTYKYHISSSIDYLYEFDYILTAANRWKNARIDDFTLILDMGELSDFNVSKSFFTSSKDWMINGIGDAYEIEKEDDYRREIGASVFCMQNGLIIFQKKNFTPQGELFVFSGRTIPLEGNHVYIPFTYYEDDVIPEPKSALEKKAWRNIPFARRGYVFTDKELQSFFESYYWYKPNPNYQPNIELLADREKEWIKKYK